VVVEDQLDKIVIMVQKLRRTVEVQAITVPISDGVGVNLKLPAAASRALKTLIFDASGNATVGTPTLQTILAVDETDTNGTKDKMVSNNLARDWTRTATVVIGVPVAMGVNQVTVTDAIATVGPTISSTGSDTHIDLNLTPKGNGSLVFDGQKWPTADGLPNQFLVTDGAAQAAWVDSGDITATSVISDMSTGSPTSLTLLTGLNGASIIEIGFQGLSLSAAATAPIIRIGDAGGIETSGYSGDGINLAGAFTKQASTAAWRS